MSHQAAIYRAENYKIHYQNKVNELQSELKKYEEAIQYYEKNGKELSGEIIRSAEKSYQSGSIDFFRLVQSIENAIQIQLDYLDNLSAFNRIVLEINYLIL